VLGRVWHFLKPTLRFWMQTEVHVHCFSVAANVILSFFPFVIVMVSICKYVFHWQPAVDAIFVALNDYFPADIIDFIRPRLAHPRRLEWLSVLLLLFAANGVFEPLEVALNRIWRIPGNRSFLKNQAVSLGLIFACGTIALLSAVATALNQSFIRNMGWGGAEVQAFLGAFAFKVAAIPLSMLILFLVYWLLPNGKMPLQRTLPAAIVVGLLLELLKYINLLAWPWLQVKFRREYGPFIYSVTIIFWSFFASMLVLAGAEWAARLEQGVTPPPELKLEPTPAIE
jgi:YihY family inner membrane protein